MCKIKLATISIFVFFVFAFNARADTLGQGRQFFISPQYDAQSRAMVNATLRYVSERAYFYVADDYWGGVSATARDQITDQIKLLAQEFDSRIYPIETQFFGSEPNPGIDGDSRTTILLSLLIKNAGGYFDTTNEYPVTEVLNSNQREIIYLNIAELANQSKMFAFLAHEFQHLISFNQKEKLRNISDDIWLNELRSEYAVTLLGYNNVYDGSHLQRRAYALLSDPSDSLTEWKNLPADYGQIGMFGEYIAELWSPQVVADTLKNNLKSIPSLNDALSQNGFFDTFTDLYRDWLIANFLNDASFDSRFGYLNKGLNDFRVNPTRTINNLDDNVPVTIADIIKDWQGRWYDISQLTAGQKNVLKITFDSPSLTSFYVPYIVFKPDGQYQAYEFKPTPNSNELYVSGIGSDASRVVIMPIKKDKLSGFSANEIPVQLTIAFERIESLPAGATAIPLTNTFISPALVVIPDSTFPDGSLIRARGDYKVYIINGKWRRHIISPQIFSFYPGLLGFDKVQETDQTVLKQYKEGNLVRYAGDESVYLIDGFGQRHWLNMNSEQFSASGRSWDSVFMINSRELNYYPLGQPILK